MTSFIQYQLTENKLEISNQQYPEIFQEIKDLISQELPNLNIEHIGSTAIPRIYAKPIIDILIPCQQVEFQHILNKLKNIGCQETPFKNIPKERPMLVAGTNYQQKFYNIHIHLTIKNSDIHLDNIYFRDQLHQDPILAQEYERIKKQAISNGAIEATAYNLAKSPFIQSILNKRKRQNNS